MVTSRHWKQLLALVYYIFLNLVTDHFKSYNYIVLQPVLLTCHVYWMISLIFFLGIDLFEVLLKICLHSTRT